ncbi:MULTISPECIES: SDR family NAD(P)-dependent oxidoreductase [unclassified Microbacterium]|uniref:SDR family NAD(P)-dependent oxidoreductase n=1 Tax=unclassified Microbacterium TaxID=2609290 RepID=UPI001AC10DEE|nr:SDR family oxidoreductase [Microbacterium sp.]MBN9158434.1 SDR family oxidoreductase [Microbacterium sp.]
MDLRLTGRTALVTAATGGLGLEMARALAAEGASVHINGRTDTSVQAAIDLIRAEDPHADVRGVVGDCGTREGCAHVIGQLPDVDILINNLGVYESQSILESTDEDWLRLFEINILSGIRVTRHYLPGMLERDRGRVLFIASEAAVMPSLELPHYSATKTMELSISRSFAETTKDTRVTVNSLLPGSSRTDGVAALVQELYPDDGYEQAEQRFMAQNRPTSLLGRLIDPDEIAQIVMFLVSDASSAFNGAALRADGGIVRTVF